MSTEPQTRTDGQQGTPLAELLDNDAPCPCGLDGCPCFGGINCPCTDPEWDGS